jgi:hypothetical protein
MRCRTAPRNDAQFNIVAPKVLVEAVQRVAARNWVSANAYARAALLKQLERDGEKLEVQNEAA